MEARDEKEKKGEAEANARKALRSSAREAREAKTEASGMEKWGRELEEKELGDP